MSALVINANAGYFQGQMDDIRVYGVALTLAQIQAIYNGGNGSPLPYSVLGARA